MTPRANREPRPMTIGLVSDWTGEVLNAAHNAVRLDECRLWTVRGSRGYVSTRPDGQRWTLAVDSKTPRHWTFEKSP